jgi:hypothetical protein
VVYRLLHRNSLARWDTLRVETALLAKRLSQVLSLDVANLRIHYLPRIRWRRRLILSLLRVTKLFLPLRLLLRDLLLDSLLLNSVARA